MLLAGRARLTWHEYTALQRANRVHSGCILDFFKIIWVVLHEIFVAVMPCRAPLLILLFFESSATYTETGKTQVKIKTYENKQHVRADLPPKSLAT